MAASRYDLPDEGDPKIDTVNVSRRVSSFGTLRWQLGHAVSVQWPPAGSMASPVKVNSDGRNRRILPPPRRWSKARAADVAMNRRSSGENLCQQCGQATASTSSCSCPPSAGDAGICDMTTSRLPEPGLLLP